MNFRITCLTLFIFIPISLRLAAQDFMGFSSGNYAGVNGLLYNPASVVDSRFIADVNLASANFSLGNNFIGFDRTTLFIPNYLSNLDFSDKYFNFATANKPYSYFNSISIEGPGALITLTKNDAFAFTTRMRNMINLDGLEKPLLDIAYANDPTQWLNQPLSNKNLQFQANLWTEYGLTYGRVILDKKEHFLKGGITVKILQGLGAAYMSINDFQYQYNGGDSIQAFQLQAEYGYSTSANYLVGGLSNYKFVADPSIGTDIGFVYEWRPRYNKHQHDMDGKTGLWNRDENKYMLRVGLSVTDLGFLRYQKAPGSYNFSANFTNIPIEAFGFVRDITTLDSTLVAIGATKEEDNGAFNQTLPTAISLQIDYNIWKGFYLNLTPFIGLRGGYSDSHKNKYWTNISLVPRWENKWIGVYLPNSYHMLNGWNSGFGLRLGPVTIGSAALISNLIKKNFENFDVYIGIKASIPHGKTKDKDKDKVSNRYDKCIDVPGVWEFKGCPDTDSDGIQDSEDACPNEAGKREFKGCPDTDDDGVPDKEDECPTEKGLVDLKGCPDKDFDNIPDNKDECPDQKGLAEFGGCPDSDSDGIPDKNDKCPTLPGPKAKFGCPDRDDDGITDDKDQCPDEAGLAENFGCPYKDTDGDGVRDLDDKCPEVPGLAELGGCPGTPKSKTSSDSTNAANPVYGADLPEELAKIAKNVREKVQFKSATSSLTAESNVPLNALADYLKKNPGYKIIIEAHTENMGDRSMNESVSKGRAQAVKTYLTGKGVSADQLIATWFGADKPIASNNTPEGKAKNRRIEIKQAP